MVLFFRRCGLKRYVSRVRHFNVDGALLMTFDPEDFELLGMTNTVHVKKVCPSHERGGQKRSLWYIVASTERISRPRERSGISGNVSDDVMLLAWSMVVLEFAGSFTKTTMYVPTLHCSIFTAEHDRVGVNRVVHFDLQLWPVV